MNSREAVVLVAVVGFDLFIPGPSLFFSQIAQNSEAVAQDGERVTTKATASSSGGGQVMICHLAQTTRTFELILVSPSSVAKHLRHGDCLIDDGIGCTIDRCDATLGCMHQPDHRQCGDGNACTADTCDQARGCLHDGTGITVPCDDHNACTSADVCLGDAAGTCAGSITPEVCNGIDDDCNGVPDDVPGIGSTCTSGGTITTGVCRAEFRCTGTPGPGPHGLTCVQVIGPHPEVCNGLDDDCDDLVDDGNPGGGQACNTGQPGVCAPGTIRCLNGVLVCAQTQQASSEVCGNGVDDDCDGEIDEPTDCQEVCAPLIPDEFEARVLGILGTLNHAKALGYSVIDSVQLCVSVGFGQVYAANLLNPNLSGPEGRITLWGSEERRAAFLLKVDAEGVPTLFNEGGGIRVLPNRDIEEVGPDGMARYGSTVASESKSVAGEFANCPDYWKFVLCEAAHVAHELIPIAEWAVYVAGICGPLIELPPAYASCVATVGGATLGMAFDPSEPPLPECPENPNEQLCDKASRCSTDDRCSFGSCWAGEPANQGIDCTDELINVIALPRCTLQGLPSRIIDTASCQGTTCKLDPPRDCDLCHACSGGPGVAECSPLPYCCGNNRVEPGEQCDGTDDSACPGQCIPAGQPNECTCSVCHSDLDCNPTATSQGVDPDADCIWILCNPQDHRSNPEGCVPYSPEVPYTAERDGSPCEDGVPCTFDEICFNGGICAATAFDDSQCPNLDDSDEDCLRGYCWYGGCALGLEPDGSPCKDAVECTTLERCVNFGICAFGGYDHSICPNQDDSDDDCLKGYCFPGGCGLGPEPDGSPCEDGNPCTVGDTCFNFGICGGGHRVCP